MLDSVFRMIRRPGPAGARARLDLAAAALMAETARLNKALLSEEQRLTVAALVRTRFMLSLPAAETLAALARDEAVESYRDAMFAGLIAEAFEPEDRRRLEELIERLFAAEPTLAKKAAAMRGHLSAVLSLEHGSDDPEARTR